jgi:hypothetical protein
MSLHLGCCGAYVRQPVSGALAGESSDQG